MSGMIITGHGSFASGMLEAIGMLTGQDARIQAVDLPPEAGEDAFCDQLKACLDRMEGCGHIYVLCDLLGGTPFKTACLLCRDLKRTDVLYGVNLPFALGLRGVSRLLIVPMIYLVISRSDTSKLSV